MTAKANKIKLSEQWDGDRFQFYKKYIKGRSFVFSQNRSEAEAIAYALQCIAPTNGEWSDEQIKAVYDCTSKNADHCITAMAPDEIKKLVADTVAATVAGMNAKPTGSSLNLYAAITEYLTDYKARVKPSRYICEQIAMQTYNLHHCELTNV